MDSSLAKTLGLDQLLKDNKKATNGHEKPQFEDNRIELLDGEEENEMAEIETNEHK